MKKDDDVCLVDSQYNLDANIEVSSDIIREASIFINNITSMEDLDKISVEQYQVILKYIQKVLEVLHVNNSSQVSLTESNKERTSAYNEYKEAYNNFLIHEEKKQSNYEAIYNVLGTALKENLIGAGFTSLDNKIIKLTEVLENLTHLLHLMVQILQAINLAINPKTDNTQATKELFDIFSNQLHILNETKVPLKFETVNNTIIKGDLRADRDVNIKTTNED